MENFKVNVSTDFVDVIRNLFVYYTWTQTFIRFTSWHICNIAKWQNKKIISFMFELVYWIEDSEAEARGKCKIYVNDEMHAFIMFVLRINFGIDNFFFILWQLSYIRDILHGSGKYELRKFFTCSYMQVNMVKRNYLQVGYVVFCYRRIKKERVAQTIFCLAIMATKVLEFTPANVVI